MPMISLDPSTRPELWSGAMAWITEDGSWRASRLPLAQLADTRYSLGLAEKVTEPAGVRLRAVSAATQLVVELSTDLDAVIDLLETGGALRRHPLLPGRTRLELELGGPGGFELWLPQRGQLRLHEVSVADGSTVAPAAPYGCSWLTYGSSISQCTTASGPSQTWPAVVSRNLNWDLTCLGFGGQCHLDPCVPDAIDTRSYDVVSLCLGINVYGTASFGPRSWRPQVAGLLARIRRSQPGAQVVVISPIASRDREHEPNAVGMSLQDYRNQVHEVVQDIVAQGEEHLHLVDGRGLIGPGEQHLMHDGVHPGPQGYLQMGQRLTERWNGLLTGPAAS